MAMLPKEYVNVLRNSIRFGAVLASHPFRWTDDGPTITSGRSNSISGVNCFLLGCYNLYLAAQTVRFLRSEGDTNMVDLVFLVNILLIYGYAFAMSVALREKKHEFVAFLKTYFDFMGSSGTLF